MVLQIGFLFANLALPLHFPFNKLLAQLFQMHNFISVQCSALSLPIHCLSSLHPVTRQEHHRTVLPTLPKFSSQPLLDDEVPRVSLCAQSCSTLCSPMNCSPPGSFVHGISQARILEWIAISSFRDFSDPGIEPMPLASPSIGRWVFNPCATWEASSQLSATFSFFKIFIGVRLPYSVMFVSYSTVN